MEKLHVVTPVFNSCRYKSRYKLYNDFENRLLKNPNVVLHTIEASFGDRPHEITDPYHPNHIQVITNQEFFCKENLINICILRSVPSEANYIAWIDADVNWVRDDWAEETVHQLQHFDVVQMFSQVHDLGPNHEIIQNNTGFGYAYQHHLPHSQFDFKFLSPYNYDKSCFWHPGFAWAARRSALDVTGNLLDWAIVGAGDHLMALAFIGEIDKGYHENCSYGFRKAATEWQKKALKLQGNIGYVDGALIHHWNGKKKNRQYRERWQ